MKRELFKVVTKERYSFSYFHNQRDNIYCLEYPVKKTVKAIKGTVGIMCFTDEEFAKAFMSFQCKYFKYRGNLTKLILIKVKPIGKKSVPHIISRVLSEEAISKFYECYSICQSKLYTTRLMETRPPDGTVCYNSVKVLT